MRKYLIIGLLFAVTSAFAQTPETPATPGATKNTPLSCHKRFVDRFNAVLAWRTLVLINSKLPKEKQDKVHLVLLKKGSYPNLFYTTRMTQACNRHDFEAYRAIYRATRDEMMKTDNLTTKDPDWGRRTSILDGRLMKWLFAAGDDCLTRGYDLSEFSPLVITDSTGSAQRLDNIAGWFQLPLDSSDEMEEVEVPHCGRQ